MSYNVDVWNTKELTDLRIPVASLYKSDSKHWHPKRTNNDDGTVTFCSSCGDADLIGVIEGDELVVSSMDVSGEGSGNALYYIFVPALKDSTGRLVASRVWESGDSIDKITVSNGVVAYQNITL